MVDAFSAGAYLLAVALLSVALLSVALLLLLASWLPRHRDRPSPADQRAALHLTPVSADTQRTVAELLRQGDHARALMALRRETKGFR